MSSRPVFRFAPSPNGDLHLGHAYSALFTAEVARRVGGRVLLRIEDIDLERCRPEFEARIYEDLAWLGFKWEKPVRRQSEHFTDYRAALDRLESLGLLYPCFATRREIAEAAAREGKTATDPDGAPLYPGIFRDAPRQETEARIRAGEPYCLRLNMAKALRVLQDIAPEPLTIQSFNEDFAITETLAQPELWGDVVLARKDMPASYHLAVVVDDALQGVTHVTRGEDLAAATGLHRLLQVLLNLPAPLYCHHRLILSEGGQKLSKRHKDKGLRALCAEGITSAEIRAMLGLPPSSVRI